MAGREPVDEGQVALRTAATKAMDATGPVVQQAMTAMSSHHRLF
jgi:hypothetical protein